MASPASGQATEMFNPPTISRRKQFLARQRGAERTDGREVERTQPRRARHTRGEGGSIESTHPTVLEAREGASPWLRRGDVTTRGPKRRTEEVGASAPLGHGAHPDLVERGA
eukprot:6214548-Pleurochrysis_carterae.AAC.2